MYSDFLFVLMGVLTSLLYHGWLWYMVKSRPHRTSQGVYNSGQVLWIAAMLKDNDKKNILAVQSLRNNLMGSSLVASSSFLLCVALLAFTGTISDKQQLVETSLNQTEVSHKCAALILAFMAVFLCEALSMTFLNQLCLVINTLILEECKVTEEQLLALLEKGMLLATLGNRLFFTAMPLLLWIYSPALVFGSSVGVVVALYSTDVVPGEKGAEVGENRGTREDIVP